MTSFVHSRTVPRTLVTAAMLVLGVHSASAQGFLASVKAKAENAVAALNAHTAAEQNTGPSANPASPKPAAPNTMVSKPVAPGTASLKPTAPGTAAPKPTAPRPASATSTAPKTVAPNAASSKPVAPKTAAPTTTAPQQNLAAPAPGAATHPTVVTQGNPAGGRAAPKLIIASADTVSGPPPTIMRELYEYPGEGRRDPFVSLLTTNELRPAMSDLRLTSILLDQSGNHSVAILRDISSNAQYRVVTGSTLGRMQVSAIRRKTVVFTIDEFGTPRQDSLVLGDSTKVRK